MLPKGFPRIPGELTIFARKSGNAGAKRDRRRLSTDGGAVLRTRSTDEGGEPQGFERSGHGTHWREGGNRCRYLAKGNIAESH
jgi:hypothetical protein